MVLQGVGSLQNYDNYGIIFALLISNYKFLLMWNVTERY
jgi:hypothetical protein